MTIRELPKNVLQRGAVVYVRQSTGAQVHDNLESQRRQYGLVELARGYGFSEVNVIDEDLGRSASGTMDRPGFGDLVGRSARAPSVPCSASKRRVSRAMDVTCISCSSFAVSLEPMSSTATVYTIRRCPTIAFCSASRHDERVRADIVAHFPRPSHSHDSGHLKKRRTMKQRSPVHGSTSRQRCC